jgi:hypothetical protein
VFSRISGRENSGGVSSHAPPPLAAREPTRRRKHWKTAGSVSASSPLPFLAGGDNHRHLQKKKKTQAKFRFFLPFFRSALFLFSLFLPV